MASMNDILAVDALNPDEETVQIAASIKSRRAKLGLMQNVLAARERSKLRYASGFDKRERSFVRRTDYFALNVL